MAVEVRLPTILRQHAGGQGSVRANGSTLGEVFDDLVRQVPGLAGQVVTDVGALHKFVNGYVKDDGVGFVVRREARVWEGGGG
ncbi:MAG: MoaD/ThiS family protein, partial [Actinobacteria bacterium]|nr:MoaD/ThiS family protein [Actinomycetota bacterium]